jgi:hypothetical protein
MILSVFKLALTSIARIPLKVRRLLVFHYVVSIS